MSLVIVPQPRRVPGQSPCGACKALYGATCCESKYGDTARFPMTYAEALRLAKLHLITVEEAVAIREVSPEEQDELRSAAGADVASLVVDGRALYLPIEAGSCRYLGPHGCTVGEIKPHICALFPFSRGPLDWELGRLVGMSGYCFAQDASNGSVQAALEMFGITLSDLDGIERRQRKDMKTHAAQMRRKWR